MNFECFDRGLLTGDNERQRMAAFNSLTFEEQARAIRRLSGSMSPHGIASATKLSVEAVRRILTDRQEAAA